MYSTQKIGLCFQCDIFQQEIVDLGKIFKVKIRHDNSLFNPSWFLDKIEVVDNLDKETYTFHCERWLAKNKDDNKIERSLYVKVCLIHLSKLIIQSSYVLVGKTYSSQWICHILHGLPVRIFPGDITIYAPIELKFHLI